MAEVVAQGGPGPRGAVGDDAVEVAVLAPVGRLVAQALEAAGGADRVRSHVVHADGDVPVTADVALVSAYWPVDAGPAFDLLDALDWLAAAASAPVVVLGRDVADPEFVNEALLHRRTAGVVPAGIAPDDLVAALAAAAADRPHPAMPRVVPSRPTLSEELAGNRLMAAVAHAVAVDGATTWSDIARASGFSVRTVQTAPRRFAPLVHADLGLPPSHDVTQPLLFHWLGTKSVYLRSWCRRNLQVRSG